MSAVERRWSCQINLTTQRASKAAVADTTSIVESSRVQTNVKSGLCKNSFMKEIALFMRLRKLAATYDAQLPKKAAEAAYKEFGEA